MKKKRHHYVPRFILEGFTDSVKGQFIYVYEKGKGFKYKSRVKNVAFIKDYYSFKKPDGKMDSETAEDMLGYIESETAPIIKKVLNFETLNDEEKMILSLFFGFTLTRSQHQRSIFENGAVQLLKQLAVSFANDQEQFDSFIRKYKHDTGKEIDFNITEFRQLISDDSIYKIEIDPMFSLQILPMAFKFADIFYAMKWNFLKATDRFKFLTSDNPLFFYDLTHNPKSSYGVGLANKNIEVIFPISKDLVFFGCWKDDLKEGFFNADNNFIKTTNRHIVINALRYVFSSEKSDGINNLVKKYNKFGGLVLRAD